MAQWFDNIIKKIIEKNIKKALEQSDIDNLRRWLAIAYSSNNRDNNKECTYYSQSLNFEFSNNQSLLDYVIAVNKSYSKHNQIEKKSSNEALFFSQSCISNLLQLHISHENSVRHQTYNKLPIMQRFFRWLSKGKSLFKFSSEAIKTTEVVLKELKNILVTNNEKSKDLEKKEIEPLQLFNKNLVKQNGKYSSDEILSNVFKEKYTPEEILDNVGLVKKMMIKEEEKKEENEVKIDEEKLNNQRMATSELNEIAIICYQERTDIKKETTIQSSIPINIAESKMDLERNLNIQTYVDHSSIINIHVNEYHANSFSRWLESLRKTLLKQNYYLQYTNDALDYLLRNETQLQTSSDSDFDFDSLPWGLFLKVNEKTIILSYSEKRYHDQKEIFEKNKISSTHKTNHQNYHDYQDYVLLSTPYRQIPPPDITLESVINSKDPTLLKKILSRKVLISVYGHNGKYQSQSITLFDLIEKLKYDVREFKDDDSIQFLYTLKNCSDDCLYLFYELAKETVYDSYDSISSQRKCFKKHCRFFFNFLSFCEENNIFSKNSEYKYSLPTQFISQLFPEHNFTASTMMKSFIEAMSRSEIPDLQKTFPLPLNTTLAKQLLQSGSYSFVHREMQLFPRSSFVSNNKSHTLGMYFKNYLINGGLVAIKIGYSNSKNEIDEMPLIFSKEDFNTFDLNINFPNKSSHFYRNFFNIYRAIYLRFIAQHISPTHVKLAIEEWEKIINLNPNKNIQTSLDDFLQFKDNWRKLTDIITKYPSRLASISFPDDNTILRKHGPLPAASQTILEKLKYKLEDLEILFRELDLEKELQNDIQSIVEILNLQLETYCRFSSDELIQKCEDLKNKLIRKEIKILPDILLLIREIYYRKTRNASQVNQGKWLRLEQIVTIICCFKKDFLCQNETGEGKSLIIAIVALLKTFSDKKVDVLTHNDFLATEGYNLMLIWANLFNLSIANKDSSKDKVINADIYYCEIGTRILDHLQFQPSTKNSKENIEVRHATDVIFDEVDYILINLNARTIFQLATKQEDTIAPSYLKKLVNNVQNSDTQFDFKKESYITYAESETESETDFNFWLTAALNAKNYKKNVDYIVEEIEENQSNDSYSENKNTNQSKRSKISLMNPDTSGRKDRRSEWSHGIHQCICARENIPIPPLTTIQSSTTVSDFVNKNYKSYCGFTGTLGNGEEINVMREIMKNPQVLKMPRAKRLETGEWHWPSITKRDNLHQIHYSRAYAFKPIFREKRKNHSEAIINILLQAKQQGMSTIIFLDTIEECIKYNELLRKDKLFDKIQIFDDTSNDETSDLRPPEILVIKKASEKGQITLTTAAGGRGTDFNKIDLALFVKPIQLAREECQRAGRVARNDKFGQIIKLYCTQDIKNFEEKLSQLQQTSDSKITETDSIIKESQRNYSLWFTETIKKRMNNSFEVTKNSGPSTEPSSFVKRK